MFSTQRSGLVKETTEDVGGALLSPSVARGAAFGDVDNDGDVDIIIANNNGQANLLVNVGPPLNNWVTFLLEGNSCNRDAIGSKLTITSSSCTQVSWVNPAASYLASNDKRVVFGLGKDATIRELVVQWPGSEKQSFENLKPNRCYRIVQGGEISVIKY